ncbi:hypothetical protein EX219_09990 [Bacillus aerophilus]|nr:hypothetical protein [Bacillus aerophilus]MBX7013562.1 hypothetical protein [Bacillus aerophilus]
MSLDETKVPILDNHKSLIIRSVADAFNKDVKAFKEEFDLETYNNVKFLKWDFTNTNIIRNLPHQNFDCVKAKRGPWIFVLIYNKISGTLFTLMRKDRFFEIQEKTKRDKIHYIDAFSSINKGEKASEVIYKQIDIFDMDSKAWNKEVNVVLEDLLKHIPGEVKKYVLLTFKNEKNEIVDFSALILTPSLGIAYEESWNEFIPADYDLTSRETEVAVDTEDEDIDLTLRENVEKDTGQNDIQLRKTEKEKDSDT